MKAFLDEKWEEWAVGDRLVWEEDYSEWQSGREEESGILRARYPLPEKPASLKAGFFVALRQAGLGVAC